MLLAAEVLPVVGVHARVSLVVLVFLVAEGAPHRLEVEQVEVNVALHFVQTVYHQLVFRVSKRAHFAVLALAQAVRVGLAELRFVLLRVIEVFAGIVRAWALVPKAALVWLDAQNRLVAAQRSATVVGVLAVVVETLLNVMRVVQRARHRLVPLQV